MMPRDNLSHYWCNRFAVEINILETGCQAGASTGKAKPANRGRERLIQQPEEMQTAG